MMRAAALVLLGASAVTGQSPACAQDANGDGIVGVDDLLNLLAEFGTTNCASVGCRHDSNGDGYIGVDDLLNMLSVYGQTCDNAPAMTALSPSVFVRSGSAQVVGDVLSVTQTGGGQLGECYTPVPVTAGDAVTIAFDMYCGDGSGADGMCVNLGVDTLGGRVGEDGVGEGVALCFDEWANGGDHGVMIFYNGETIWEDVSSSPNRSGDAPVSYFEDATWHSVTLDVVPNGDNAMVSFDFDGFYGVTDQVAAGYSMPDAVFVGFTGRTGGATNNHWAQNIQYSVNGQAPAPPPAWVAPPPPPPYVPSVPGQQIGITFVHCLPGAGMIESEAECQAAALAAGVPWNGGAGAEWASGCLFHGGGVYYSNHEDGSTQNPTDAYVCNVLGPVMTYTHCLPGAGMIESEAECMAAADSIGAPWASAAGTEWASGCLFHGGSVYYSDHEDGSTQNPTDAYVCYATPPSSAGCVPSATCGPFIAEAAEGSSNNKYLEFYNPTNEVIDLSGYAYPNSNNGATVDGVYDYWNAFDAGATIAPGELYVVCHPSADATILPFCDQTHAYLSNGDDGYCLVSGDESSYTILDCVGDWSATDPGSGWDVCGIGSTQDGTVVRNCDVTVGNPDWGISAAADTCEWDRLGQNTWDMLGFHGCDGAGR